MAVPAQQRIDGIDFWRGFVLITIFVNHAPTNIVSYFTHHNFGFSDGAEAFVFLSGLSVALAYGRRFLDGQFARSIRATYRRALTLYWVQLAVSLGSIAFLVGAAYVLGSDDLTDENDREAILNDPLRAIPAMFVLAHQVGFFNILPLYIVFLLATPALLALARVDRRLMLVASGALYLAVRQYSLQIPTWPLEGYWYFNPLAWQFVFTIGLYFGLGLNKDVVPRDRILFAVCVAYLAGSLFVIMNGFGLWPDLWEYMRSHVEHDKTSLSWIRLVHFLALTYVIYCSGLTGLLRTTPVFAPLALMGRHSLPVFATGAFMTVVGEAIVETEIPDFLAQFIIITGGIIVQYWVARYFEARVLAKKAAAASAPAEAPRTGASHPREQSADTPVAV
jgi:hypothetical protein